MLETCMAAVLVGVMRLLGCPFGGTWCFVCEVCRLIEGVPCRLCSLALPCVWRSLRVRQTQQGHRQNPLTGSQRSPVCIAGGPSRKPTQTPVAVMILNHYIISATKPPAPAGTRGQPLPRSLRVVSCVFTAKSSYSSEVCRLVGKE